MKKVLITLLALGNSVGAVEVGLKLGWAQVSVNRENLDFDTIASLYVNVDMVSTSFFEAGPQINLAHAERTLFSDICYDLLTRCDYDFTYTSFELNGYGKLGLGMFRIYGGAGVSLNRFRLEVKEADTGEVVYVPASETYGGYQFFGGVQLSFGAVGVGGEFKYKRFNSEEFTDMRVASLFVSYSF
ncbi:MAG TPA: hypothetical protein EYH49_00145 [Aquifex aeolicus]|nr:hypothetical protein [Aquifex aeolicus]